MPDNQNRPNSFPTKPDEGATSSSEVFKCWNCGTMYPTSGQSEGQCPVCGESCSRERCEVLDASNEGF